MLPVTESEWIEFLTLWNKQAYDVVLKAVIEKGYLSSIVTNSKEDLEEYEYLGINIPREVCLGGGMTYPPVSEAEQREFERQLQIIRQIVERYHSREVVCSYLFKEDYFSRNSLLTTAEGKQELDRKDQVIWGLLERIDSYSRQAVRNYLVKEGYFSRVELLTLEESKQAIERKNQIIWRLTKSADSLVKSNDILILYDISYYYYTPSYREYVVRNQGLGPIGPGATEEELADFEKCHQLRLPEPYRNFLKVTPQGWLLTVAMLVPWSRLTTAAARAPIDQRFAGAVEDYLDYFLEAENITTKNSQNSLVISQLVSPFGEYMFLIKDSQNDEWLFIDLVNERIFQSFHELIQYYYASSIEERHWSRPNKKPLTKPLSTT